MRIPLDDHWTLHPTSGVIPEAIGAAGAIAATVPGTVHTDLLAAGLIPDPYLDDNERLSAWIGRADWRYVREIEWTPTGDDRVDLVFEGLDTIAEVELNGEVIAHTADMHRTHRIDVTGGLRPGANTLAVAFASAVAYADRASLDQGARPHVNHHPYNAIRKMACNFGWDWGPDLVTAGIWRPAALHSWSGARLASVRPVVTVERGDSGTRGTVDVHIDVEWAGAGEPLLVAVDLAGGRTTMALAAGVVSGVVTVVVDDVELWWPRGHGAQPLYDLAVTLERAEVPLDRWSARIGFRSVRVDTPQDERGTGFTFVVNDRPIFVKGANWIPDDAFPHRVTRQRYSDRTAQAADAGINLLRVWGGGIYEADDFYAECDERGIMVWQDFLFACAAYAEEEPMRSEVIAEATDNVTRLMPHPSLVMWNGCNENLWGYTDWGWESRLDGKTWGLGYYTEILPAIVARLDPGRPYCPGSPWSLSPDRHPNDEQHGTVHFWDVWNQLDYTTYLDKSPRFAAEFGWQGPPTWSTLRRAISDDPLTPESPGMLVHQKAAEGHAKLTTGLVAHLPVPDRVTDWHWAMSLNQARAVQLGIEHFRALTPLCSGSIMWQLNDCWPVTSWAAIDGDGRRKPLFYALRHAHADRLVTIEPRGDNLVAVLVNDTDEAWIGPVSLTRHANGGDILAHQDLTVDVAARSTSVVDLARPLVTPDRPADELLAVTLGERRALWFFTEDRDSTLVAGAFEAKAIQTATGYQVAVTASSTVRDLALLVDTIDPAAVVDDMLLTLLPGETVTFDVISAMTVDPARFVAPDVLKCANDLVSGLGSGAAADPA